MLFYYPQVNTDLPGKSSFYDLLPVTIILKKLKKYKFLQISADHELSQTWVGMKMVSPSFFVTFFSRFTD